MIHLRTSVLGLILAVGTLAGTLTPAARAAGELILVADRDLDTVYLLDDADASGSIEAAEVHVFFSGSNAAGTPVPGTWTSMSYRSDGFIAVGDSNLRLIIGMKDLNRDGDAQDADESWIVATNSTWSSFGSPSGIAFDTRGTMFVANSGNGAVPVDGVFKLVDLNRDRDCEDVVEGGPERVEFCTAPPLGPGNTSRVPSEMCFSSGGLYFRDSGSGSQGIWQVKDLDGDGTANQPGELTGFAVNGNESAWTFGAGLLIEPDLAREGAFYTLQVVSGADQLVRAVDANGDGDAMDLGEIVLAYSTSEANFSPTDILCLPDGSVILADSSGQKAYRLTDADGDGVFGAGERSVWFDNSPVVVGDLRKVVLVPEFCPADLDGAGGDRLPDGGVDINDLLAFLTEFEAGSVAADLDNDGLDPAQPDGGVDINDLLFFLTHFEAGC